MKQQMNTLSRYLITLSITIALSVGISIASIFVFVFSPFVAVYWMIRNSPRKEKGKKEKKGNDVETFMNDIRDSLKPKWKKEHEEIYGEL